MKKVYGILMLLVFGLLASGTLVADGVMPSDEISFSIPTETKIVTMEEVTVVYNNDSENVTASAVVPLQSEISGYANGMNSFYNYSVGSSFLTSGGISLNASMIVLS